MNLANQIENQHSFGTFLVDLEVTSLRHLSRPDDVKTVLGNSWRSSGKNKPELPKVVQQMLGSLMGDLQNRDFEKSILQSDEDLELPRGESSELREKLHVCEVKEG